MDANVNNSVKLKNLTYSDVVENLSHVCFGSYHLPENDGTCTTVNNESAFEYWKHRMLLRYPNAEVHFDVQAVWSSRVLIEDKTFIYDRSVFSRAIQSLTV